MTDNKIRILYIEDDAGLARLLSKHMRRQGYEMQWAADGRAGLESLQHHTFDVVAIDYDMPVLDGLSVLERMQDMANAPPAIMISGAGGMDTAIAALKAGAADYVVKTVDQSYLELLPRTIDKVLEKQRLKAEAAAAQEALREQTELLSLTLGSISQGLTVFDQHLRLVTWNQRWLNLEANAEGAAVTGAPLSSFTALNHAPEEGLLKGQSNISENIKRARNGEAQVGEYLLADGRAIEVRSSPMSNGGVVSTYTDISERKAGEEETRVAAAVFQTAAEPMLITDKELNIERCNPAFVTLLGYTKEELYRKKPTVLASDQHDSRFFDAMWKELRDKDHWRGTLWNCRKDGMLTAQQVSISAIKNELAQVEHFVAVYTDVTEQLRREEGVRHQAYHDALTGLPNRRLLIDRITQAIESAKYDHRGFALLFIDLDGFKPINDNHGHRVGDLLLQEVAQQLLANCRDSDTVARYGGDEFVILLRNAHEPETVSGIAQSLIDQVAQPVAIGETAHRVSLSIGIALYPHHDTHPAGLIKKADKAMYDAKSAGRGRLCLYQR